MKTSWKINQVLTGSAKRFIAQSPYAALRIAPVLYVAVQAAQYGVFDPLNDLDIPKLTPRAPSTEAKRGYMKLSNDMFGTKEYEFEMPVDDRIKAIYDSVLDADSAASNTAAHIVLFNHEVRVKTLIDGAGIANANVGVKWNAANSDPIADADAIRETIRLGCGMNPNLVTCSVPVFNVLKSHPKILERIKYTQNSMNITPALVAQALGVDMLNVAGAIQNVAAEGQALQPQDLWGDSVYFSVTNPGQDLMALNLVRTFQWTGNGNGRSAALIKSYYDDHVESLIHKAKHDVDERIVCAAAGYRLGDVL